MFYLQDQRTYAHSEVDFDILDSCTTADDHGNEHVVFLTSESVLVLRRHGDGLDTVLSAPHRLVHPQKVLVTNGNATLVILNLCTLKAFSLRLGPGRRPALVSTRLPFATPDVHSMCPAPLGLYYSCGPAVLFMGMNATQPVLVYDATDIATDSPSRVDSIQAGGAGLLLTVKSPSAMQTVLVRVGKTARSIPADCGAVVPGGSAVVTARGDAIVTYSLPDLAQIATHTARGAVSAVQVAGDDLLLVGAGGGWVEAVSPLLYIIGTVKLPGPVSRGLRCSNTLIFTGLRDVLLCPVLAPSGAGLLGQGDFTIPHSITEPRPIPHTLDSDGPVIVGMTDGMDAVAITRSHTLARTPAPTDLSSYQWTSSPGRAGWAVLVGGRLIEGVMEKVKGSLGKKLRRSECRMGSKISVGLRLAIRVDGATVTTHPLPPGQVPTGHVSAGEGHIAWITRSTHIGADGIVIARHTPYEVLTEVQLPPTIRVVTVATIDGGPSPPVALILSVDGTVFSLAPGLTPSAVASHVAQLTVVPAARLPGPMAAHLAVCARRRLVGTTNLSDTLSLLIPLKVNPKRIVAESLACLTYPMTVPDAPLLGPLNPAPTPTLGIPAMVAVHTAPFVTFEVVTLADVILANLIRNGRVADVATLCTNLPDTDHHSLAEAVARLYGSAFDGTLPSSVAKRLIPEFWTVHDALPHPALQARALGMLHKRLEDGQWDTAVALLGQTRPVLDAVLQHVRASPEAAGGLVRVLLGFEEIEPGSVPADVWPEYLAALVRMRHLDALIPAVTFLDAADGEAVSTVYDTLYKTIDELDSESLSFFIRAVTALICAGRPPPPSLPPAQVSLSKCLELGRHTPLDVGDVPSVMLTSGQAVAGVGLLLAAGQLDTARRESERLGDEVWELWDVARMLDGEGKAV